MSRATIAVTGGTGSFGRAFVEFLLAQPDPPSVRIISRDEHKQESMAARFPPSARLSYILADVRDGGRMRSALRGCDLLVHAAALKLVPAGERHTDEFVKINIIGTTKIISAALECGVLRSLLISSDKAVSAYNAYGKSKAVAETLFTHANQLGAGRGLRFASVRGGNVWGSRGSVAIRWRLAAVEGGPLEVTDAETTRFHLPMGEWTTFCWRALNAMGGGEVFAPKLRAWRLGDLAEACAQTYGLTVSVIGAREGDKRREALVSPEEAAQAVDVGWAYVIEPAESLRAVWNYAPQAGEKLAGAVTSSDAPRMGMDELRGLVSGWRTMTNDK